MNTTESLASARMKQLVLESDITDIEYSAEVDGVGANWLRQTMPKQSLLGDGTPGKLDVNAILGDQKRWRDILSVGHGVGSIHDIPPVGDLIARMAEEYDASTIRLARHLVRAQADATGRPTLVEG